MVESIVAFKGKQKYTGSGEQVVYVGNEFHDYFRRIPFEYLRRLIQREGVPLTDKLLHVASCGSGIDIFYLQKFLGHRIFVTDFSEEAVATTAQSFPGVQGQVQDLERLSFEDDHFDYSYVAASLHHLPRPILGLYELLRVSRYGVMVIEPNDSWLTRLATRLGLAQKIERSGNYVYRISKRDVEKLASSLFCNYSVVRCFAVHQIAKSRLEFVCLKIANGLFNLCCPALGNYIIFIIRKSGNVDADDERHE
jgi:ubiquinone/menaquinone biosynthesis C-methylase UbiE